MGPELKRCRKMLKIGIDLHLLRTDPLKDPCTNELLTRVQLLSSLIYVGLKYKRYRIHIGSQQTRVTELHSYTVTRGDDFFSVVIPPFFDRRDTRVGRYRTMAGAKIETCVGMAR